MGQRPQQGTVSMSFYGQLYPLDQRAQTCTLMGANQVVYMVYGSQGERKNTN